MQDSTNYEVVYLKSCQFFLQVGIVPHLFGIVNGRLQCVFSRVISVIPGEEGSDLDLNASYYIIIGTGATPGKP